MRIIIGICCSHTFDTRAPLKQSQIDKSNDCKSKLNWVPLEDPVAINCTITRQLWWFSSLPATYGRDGITVRCPEKELNSPRAILFSELCSFLMEIRYLVKILIGHKLPLCPTMKR